MADKRVISIFSIMTMVIFQIAKNSALFSVSFEWRGSACRWYWRVGFMCMGIMRIRMINKIDHRNVQSFSISVHILFWIEMWIYENKYLCRLNTDEFQDHRAYIRLLLLGTLYRFTPVGYPIETHILALASHLYLSGDKVKAKHKQPNTRRRESDDLAENKSSDGLLLLRIGVASRLIR